MVLRLRSWFVGMLSATLAVAMLMLSACGGGPSYPQIGEKGEGTLDVLVTNSLGDNISSLKMRATGTDAWGPELLGEEQVLAADETAELHVSPLDGAESYDLLLGKASGDEVEVHGVDLASYASMSLCFEDEVGFVSFTDADGNEGSTKDAALAEKKAAEEEEARKKAEEEAEAKRKAEEEAEAKRKAEEEAARKAEEEAAAAAAAEEESSYYEDSYSESYYEPSYSEPSYSEPEYSAPAQSEMDCTRDNIVLDN